MMKGLIGLGALVAAVLGGAAVAQGAGPHGRGAMMQNMISQRITKMEDAIDATQAQRDQIEQSKQVVLNALKAQRQTHKGDHAKLIEVLTADNLDSNALYAVAEQHKSDIDALAKVIIPEIKKVHDVLTPEQRQILAQKAKEMQQRHQRGGGNGQ
jgi:Spy/CpxP family protein refolding chaperone